ncbi:DinB family protein [uncultured Altibacter sp.]
MSYGVVLFGQQITVKTAFLEKWENSKSYLLTIAEAMPEELYDFRPTERQMTFKEQLVHMKSNMDWLSLTYFTQETFDRSNIPLPETKAATITLLTEAFENTATLIQNTSEADFEAVVDFFSGPKSKLQILNLLQDHVSHHRGQLIVYLNLNNIAPPPYVGW